MNKLHSKIKRLGLKIGTYNIELNDNYLVNSGKTLMFVLFTPQHQYNHRPAHQYGHRHGHQYDERPGYHHHQYNEHIPVEYHGQVEEEMITRFLDEYGFSLHSEL